MSRHHIPGVRHGNCIAFACWLLLTRRPRLLFRNRKGHWMALTRRGLVVHFKDARRPGAADCGGWWYLGHVDVFRPTEWQKRKWGLPGTGRPVLPSFSPSVRGGGPADRRRPGCTDADAWPAGGP